MPAFLWQFAARVRTQIMAAPSITIKAYPPQLAVGEWGSVSLALIVPSGRSIVSIVATLKGDSGNTYDSTITAINANAATGIALPTAPAGRYRLTVQIRDDKGGSDATAMKREVVVS